EVLRHGQQAPPLHVQVGERDAHGAGDAQRRANGHAQEQQRQEGDEEQRRDHGRRPRRMNRPSARPAIATDITGIHIVYHQIGTPMPGEVSPKRTSSYTTRALNTASTAKKTNIISAPKRASAR